MENKKTYYVFGIVGFGMIDPKYGIQYKEHAYVSEEDFKWMQQFRLDKYIYNINGIIYDFQRKEKTGTLGIIGGGIEFTDVKNPKKIPLNLYYNMLMNKKDEEMEFNKITDYLYKLNYELKKIDKFLDEKNFNSFNFCYSLMNDYIILHCFYGIATDKIKDNISMKKYKIDDSAIEYNFLKNITNVIKQKYDL